MPVHYGNIARWQFKATADHGNVKRDIFTLDNGVRVEIFNGCAYERQRLAGSVANPGPAKYEADCFRPVVDEQLIDWQLTQDEYSSPQVDVTNVRNRTTTTFSGCVVRCIDPAGCQ